MTRRISATALAAIMLAGPAAAAESTDSAVLRTMTFDVDVHVIAHRATRRAKGRAPRARPR